MSPSDWIGIVGGFAGVFALSIEAYSHWIKRKPRLSLFVPYHFIGDDLQLNQRTLFALARVSNTSERIAHLYMETLRAEILYKGRWYQMSVSSFIPEVPIEVDLPEQHLHDAGVKYVKLFNKFDPAVVAIDMPYSRYIAMSCHDRGAVNNAERLRIEFLDCNLKKHVIEANILKNDPQHLNTN